MFCEKCGIEVGDARFCPRCGNRIIGDTEKSENENPNTGHEVPDNNSTVADDRTVQGNNSVPENSTPYMNHAGYGYNSTVPDMNNSSDYNNNPSNNVNMNQMGENNNSFSDIPLKKKKQWPMITGIIAAVLILLSASTYFAWPMIMNAVNPSYDAVAALKKSTAGFGEVMKGTLMNMVSDTGTGKRQIKGSFTIDKASVAGSDFLSLLKADTFNYDLQFSSKEGQMAGTIGLGSSDSASDLEMNMYMDEKELIFKIPSLLSNSYRADMSTIMSGAKNGFEFNLPMSSLENLDPEEMEIITEAIVNSSVSAVNNLIDNLKYKKIGEERYRSENGKIRAKVYDVTISSERVKECFIEIVNNLYSDSSISSYTAMLSLFGYNKNQILQEIEKIDFGLKERIYTIYVDSNQNIVKIINEAKSRTASRNNQMVLEFIGKENPMDYFKFYFIAEGSELSFTSVKEENNLTLKMDITPKQTGSTAGQHISFGLIMSYDQENMASVLDSEFYIRADLGNNQKMDFEMSGKSSTNVLESVNISKSAMGNPVDLNKMTSAQDQQMNLDLYRNFPVFKKILADPLYNTLYSSIFGYTG